MKHKLFTYFVILGALLTFPVNAAVFRGNDNYALPGGVTINDNFFAAGGSLTISGDINGDSFLAGGIIQSTGRVANDLHAAGGNINILSEVGDDLRVAGGSISINSYVRGEVMAAGGQINLQQNSSTTGDVYATGGLIVLNGVVNGNVYANGGKIELRGAVNGSVFIDNAGELVVGNNAVVGGKLSYRAPNQAVIPPSAQISNVEFSQLTEVRRDPERIGAIIGILWVVRLLAILVSALVLYFIFKGGVTLTVLGTFNNFWIKVLTGFIALIITPIALILILITIVGIPISLLLGLIYFLFILLARLGAGVVFGVWLFSLFRRSSDFKYQLNALTIIVGILALSIIGLIPIVGWFVSFIFFLAMFGQLFWWFYDGAKRLR